MVRPIDADELLEFPYSESVGMNEQIVDWIEKCGLSDDEEVIDRAEKLCWAVIEGFINVIKTAPTLTPPNEPLTIEQLWEMDGEPVFVIINGIEPLKIWALVEVIETAKCINLTNNIGGSSEYYSQEDLDNDSITVYRRPPEEET